MNNDDLYTTGLRLWQRWTEMWNGAPQLARELVADGFVLHLPTPSLVDLARVTDGPSVEAWVAAHRARFERLTFEYPSGPYVDVRAGVVAGPWIARKTVDGREQAVVGMDTIAFAGGKITEYWTLSKEVDAHHRWGERTGGPPAHR